MFPFIKFGWFRLLFRDEFMVWFLMARLIMDLLDKNIIVFGMSILIDSGILLDEGLVM